MNRQPVLHGDRLTLRPLAADDWVGLFAVAADPLLWAQHPVHTRWQEPVFRAFFADALASGGAMAAVERESGTIVGSSRWDRHDPAARTVEIGWTFLARHLWGTGANAEMKRLMLVHAFQWVDRVEFRIGDTNLRSRRAMERIGGRLTDRVEILEAPTGAIRHLVYAITREDFTAGPLTS